MKANLIRRSLRVKLILFMLLAISVPMLISIFVTNNKTSEIVAEDKIAQTSNLIFQGKTNLDHYFDLTNQASLLPYNDSKFGFGDTLYRILEKGQTDYIAEGEIYRTLQSISLSIKETHQVYLYGERSGKGYSVIKGRFFKKEQTEPFPSTRQADEQSIHVEDSHLSHSYGINITYYPPKEVITIHRRIDQIPSGKVLGTLAIDLSTSVIDAICSQLYTSGKEQLYLLSSSGAVIYGPNPQQRGELLKEQWAQEVIQSGSETGSRQIRTDSFNGVYVYDKLQTPFLDWTLVKLIPQEVINAGTRQVTEVNTIILGLFLLVTIIAAVYVSLWITSPIKKLIGSMNRIQSGELDVDIRLQRTDEIGELARRFRLMMETINNLILREYKLELASKSNQLKALQAQVQPHFIYNAMQSIGTLALQQGAPKVYTLILQLSRMMRYTMNTSDQLVTVAQEIEHTEAYLALQKHRFGDHLTVEVEAAAESLVVPVPRMIIQPLVENIFKHAFDPAGGVISLAIRTWVEHGCLVIEVEDDGTGMTGERLAALSEALDRAEDDGLKSGESIGLGNVISRLRLRCSEESSIRLEPNTPSGLIVTLTIPIPAIQEGTDYS
ncbi:sensor histidine kinase [Paenibacillus sp. GCM10023252]|uniref:cache domain-containing sensor histidine kinase n=1 Tax=Paenibacillus sp. GCM10023252 TaxID=3252649 RepID=UPI00362122EA